MISLSEPNEDYLERIFELLKEKGYARVSDMAEKLAIKPASVTKMVQKLGLAGYIRREPYRGFTLTKLGRGVAVKISRRHRVLLEFLTLLGISKRTALRDIEGMEHHLSDETVRAFERTITHLRMVAKYHFKEKKEKNNDGLMKEVEAEGMTTKKAK